MIKKLIILTIALVSIFSLAIACDNTHVHSMIKHDAFSATCSTGGNKEYYECSECHKLYLDSQGEHETSLTEVTVASTGHTADTEWQKDKNYHWHVCTVCGEKVDKSVHDGGDDDICDDCKYKIVFSKGLEYKLNSDQDTYTVIGIGECKDTGIIIPIKYNDKLITGIDDWAFRNDNSIKSVEIPSSILNIGAGAFNGCKNLKKVYINDIESWCKIKFGDYDANPLNGGADLYVGAKEESVTKLAIPASITEINDYALWGCFNLVSVEIPDSVTTIGEGAFGNCIALNKVTISSSVKSLGNSAFSGCDKLATITIPDSVISIGSGAFDNCKSLKNLEIPSSVKSIGKSAFSGCDNLQYNINEGIKYLGNQGNSYLALIEPEDKSKASYTINVNTAIIAGGAFYNCGNVANLTVPDSVISIGSGAFLNCNSLISVTFENSSGWKRYEEPYSENGTEIVGLSSGSDAAQYLRDSYKNYYWKRG